MRYRKNRWVEQGDAYKLFKWITTFLSCMMAVLSSWFLHMSSTGCRFVNCSYSCSNAIHNCVLECLAVLTVRSGNTCFSSSLNGINWNWGRSNHRSNRNWSVELIDLFQINSFYFEFRPFLVNFWFILCFSCVIFCNPFYVIVPMSLFLCHCQDQFKNCSVHPHL